MKSNTGEKMQELSFSDFMREVNKNETNVRDVVISGTEVTGHLKTDNRAFKSTVPANYPDLYKSLLDKGISAQVKDSSGGSWMTWVGNGLPMIVLLGR